MRSKGLALVLVAAPALAAAADDAADVRAVVESAYVRGVHASFDAEAMRKGFHPDFRMYVLRDGALTAVSRDEWIGRLEGRAREEARSPRVEADFPVVDVTGDTAVVRVELRRDGKHAFTDYLSLYRFADGWRIVAKVFQAR